MNTNDLILKRENVKRFSLGNVSETMSDKKLKAILGGYGGYDGPFWKVTCIDANRNEWKECVSITDYDDCLAAQDAICLNDDVFTSCVSVTSCP
jgi:hypothetical protein